jgi:hypothetical protein
MLYWPKLAGKARRDNFGRGPKPARTKPWYRRDGFMKTFAVCILGTCICVASCGDSGDKQLPRAEAGEAGEGTNGGDASTAGGSLGTGLGGKASGGTGVGHEGGEGALGGVSSSGAQTTGQGGDASGAAGAPSSGAGTSGGEGGAATCEVGEAQSPAAPGTLDLFGQIAYFGSGGELPAGHYRVTYLDGCMKYASDQDWAIHAYGDGSIAWWLGSTSGNKLVLLPGTVGIFQGQGGYTDFEGCVAANLPLPPIEFDFAGGVLGVWLADSNYGDNVSGVDGRNPVWKLTLLDSVCE